MFRQIFFKNPQPLSARFNQLGLVLRLVIVRLASVHGKALRS